MPADWIIFVSAILLISLYVFVSLKIDRRRQKRLLQKQVDKWGGQVDKSPMLILTMGNFKLHIVPDISAGKKNYNIMAVLVWSGSDLSERVSHFPKIAVFKNKSSSLTRMPVIQRSNMNEPEWEESHIQQKQERFLSGDKNFDNIFSVYAENEADIHQILTAEVRQGFLDLAHKSPRLRTDEMRFLAVLQEIRDTDTYDSFINLAVTISEKLTGSSISIKDSESENLISASLENRKENTMSFFKKLFNKEEPFVPTPTQDVPGLDPLVVHAIENLFPDIEVQKQAFDFSLKYLDTEKGNIRTLLGLLRMGIVDIDDPTLINNRDNGRFWMDVEYGLLSMKGAKRWVKSITKSQDQDE